MLLITEPSPAPKPAMLLITEPSPAPGPAIAGWAFAGASSDGWPANPGLGHPKKVW
jgi:hypothetical protein